MSERTKTVLLFLGVEQVSGDSFMISSFCQTCFFVYSSGDLIITCNSFLDQTFSLVRYDLIIVLQQNKFTSVFLF